MLSKSLDFRFFESLKSALSRTFCSPKLSLESWILHSLCENFPEYPLERAMQTSIIVYLIPQHCPWFKNYKLLILKLVLGFFFACAKTISPFVDTVHCSWWRWLPRATHAPNFVTSSQGSHIEFIKSVIDLENS